MTTLALVRTGVPRCQSLLLLLVVVCVCVCVWGGVVRIVVWLCVRVCVRV